MTYDRLQMILKELGEKTGIRDLGLDDSNGCSIRLNIEGAPLIHLHYVPPDDELITFAILGFVPEDNSAELFRGFLQNNLFWEEAKGAIFALIPETGELVLQRKDKGYTLSPEFLETALENFVESMLEARGKLFAPAQQDSPAKNVNPEHGVRA
jgi:hypothetical protein